MFIKPLWNSCIISKYAETCGKGQRSAPMARSDVDQFCALSTF